MTLREQFINDCPTMEEKDTHDPAFYFGNYSAWLEKKLESDRSLLEEAVKFLNFSCEYRGFTGCNSCATNFDCFVRNFLTRAKREAREVLYFALTDKWVEETDDKVKHLLATYPEDSSSEIPNKSDMVRDDSRALLEEATELLKLAWEKIDGDYEYDTWVEYKRVRDFLARAAKLEEEGK